MSVAAIASLVAFGLLSLASIALADDAESGSVWLFFLPQLAACIWVGWALRELAWIEGALALAPVFLAMPFGLTDSSSGEGGPIVLVEVLLTPVNLALMIGGTALYRHVRSRRAASNGAGRSR